MHIIHHRMYNVFEIPDTNNPEAKWNLFQWLGSFPLKYVITHIQKICITYGKYNLDNLEWSGNYPRKNMYTDLLTKVLIHVNIYACVPKVLSNNILAIHYSNFEVIYKVWDKLRDVKLSDLPTKISMTVAVFRWHYLRGWVILDTSSPITSPV